MQTGRPEPACVPIEKTAHVQSLEDELRRKLSVKFEIRVKGKDRGQIVIGFESNDDFERVIDCACAADPANQDHRWWVESS